VFRFQALNIAGFLRRFFPLLWSEVPPVEPAVLNALPESCAAGATSLFLQLLYSGAFGE
jgi:hypothetical protein